MTIGFFEKFIMILGFQFVNGSYQFVVALSCLLTLDISFLLNVNILWLHEYSFEQEIV